MKLEKYILVVLILLLVFFTFMPAFKAEQSINKEKVYILPVKGVINKGVEQFIKRGIKKAEAEKVKAIIFEIDTPGGEVRAADNISKAILDTSLPTISFINNEASSAGVIVAISCEKIYMSPNSTIGAAETRPKEEKYISYWSSRLQSVAEENGRDAKLIAAMADADIEIKGIKQKGKILSLTTRQAINIKLADDIAENYEELLIKANLKDNLVVEIKKNPAEKFVQLLMNPYITLILLAIGFIGVITEIFTPGFGLPGIIGILAFGMLFGANIMIEATKYWIIGIFILGIMLLIIEIFVPGFGVFGVLGTIFCILSIIFAFPDTKQIFVSIVFAFIISCIIIYLLLRYIIKTPISSTIILETKQEKSKGYIASHKNIQEFLGKKGISLTPLRPSGLAMFDGKKLDVLSDGEFISKGEKIEVVKVEGNKIIVKRKGSDV